MNSSLRLLISVLVILALASGLALLTDATKSGLPLGLSASALSAAPLFLVGIAFLIFQPMLRPRWTALLKNMLLAATFLLWGAVQLMPRNALSEWLGDLVIVLYVFDLAWVILAGLYSDERQRG
jgi:peptidoglycan/LPS O-acetylase OafA/YrhL